MKRLIFALALAATACAPGPRGAGGPPLRPVAEPSAVIAAEIGFNQLAQTKGQWTAFRESAAKGAEMFVPDRVLAETWLKGRADPSVPVTWQAHAVWSSCDGSRAVTRGAWQRPGSAGSYITVWQRQKDGKYKWLLDMSLADEAVATAPEMVASRTADCGRTPAQRASLAADEASRIAAGAAFGGSGDATLRWTSRVTANGTRRFEVSLWNGTAFETVIDTDRPPLPR